MAGIPLSAINKHTVGTLLQELQKQCSSDVVLVRLEVIQHAAAGTRELVFWYSRISEGLKVRAARKPDDECPQYPLKFPVPLWNTHIDIDLILAKLALVR